jgi:hypothetical protein
MTGGKDALDSPSSPIEDRSPAHRLMRLQAHLQSVDQFQKSANEIIAMHKAQTLADVDRLRRKYEMPVFGSIKPWSLVEMLAQCIDPTDSLLLCASQQVHVLQVIEGMERDGVATEELILAALLHDLGKVLLIAGEAPENVIGFNAPIGTYEPGIGLDQCVFQWNHDEFVYSRLKPHVSDRLAWLIRYHSIIPSRCAQYMDARDRDYMNRVLLTFSHYDHETKSHSSVPRVRIRDYRPLLERALPERIVF